MAPLTLKEGELFFLTDRRGDVPGDCYGLYIQDTQFLDRWRLRVAGQPLTVLSARSSEIWRSSILMANGQEVSLPGLQPMELEVLRRQATAGGAIYEEIRLMNRGRESVQLPVSIEYDSGFYDLFEYRGFTRERRGQAEPVVQEAGRVVLGYRGLDKVRRRTLIQWLTPPNQPSPHGVARWEVNLEPGSTQVLSAMIAPVVGEGPLPEAMEFDRASRMMMAAYADWCEERSRLQSQHSDVDRLLDRLLRDLRALTMDLGYGPFPAAGVPWLATLFGRDTLISAYQALLLDPAYAKGALRTLAAFQGREEVASRAEEPGKILHELRRGEMAALGEIPFARYYGTVEATPLFLILLSEYHRWTGDDPFLREMLPHARAALRWMDRYGDQDQDGLLECEPVREQGLAVQSWKDTPTAFALPGRSQPELPVAPIEIQGYAYDAYRRMAEVLEHLGEDPNEVSHLRERAATIRHLFEERYWMEEKGYYAIALDRAKNQVPIVSSDPGRSLWSAILSPERARAVAERLMEPDLFSGWGIRTMSEQEPHFSPIHYHHGSVWTHDNGLIALGLSHYGLTEPLQRVARALMEAARHFEEYRLPEVFCGYASEDGPPVPFPAASSPHAWAVGTPLLLIRALLGLEPDAPAGLIRLRPRLPEAQGRLKLSGLRIGRGRLDLAVRGSHVEILRNTTGLSVVIDKEEESR